ncbi:MAG TPA: response regulator transcription factor [Casimicrobiaceae bacterium]|jgi:DNA-binding NarL/FixJ family response regulator|nr:response regulator transcription factor [Casimicrobiaceae bacterium]
MLAALLVKTALLRVFVVEDSALIRRRIIDNLQSMGGYDVVGFAESEDEAIAAIKNLHPDVVVTDIRLKEGNGIAVVRNIRADETTPQPKIFVLTNFAYPEYQVQCSLAGADAFFDKSSEYDSFLTRLRQIM